MSATISNIPQERPTATPTAECPDCGGTGRLSGAGANYPGKRVSYGDCSTCSGRGEIETRPESTDDDEE